MISLLTIDQATKALGVPRYCGRSIQVNLNR